MGQRRVHGQDTVRQCAGLFGVSSSIGKHAIFPAAELVSGAARPQAPERICRLNDGAQL